MKNLKATPPATNKKLKSVTYFFIYFYAIIALIFNPFFFETIISEDKDLGKNLYDILMVVFISFIFFIAILVFCLLLLKKGKKRTLEIINNINLSIFFILLILLVFELIFRFIIKPHEPLKLYSYNKYLDFAYMKPNQKVNIVTDEYNVILSTNNIGLRSDKDFTLPKQQNEIRIMNIGDSFIQAAQVNLEETMSFLLDKKLNAAFSKKKHTVYNIGTSGFGPGAQKEFIKRNIKVFRPDYIFLFLYIGNDIITIASIPEVNPPKSALASYVDSFILNLSRISKFVNYFNIRLKPSEPEWTGPMGRPCQPFDTLPEEISANIFLKKYNKYIKDAFERTFIDLSIISDICTENKVKYAVFIVPTKEQVEEEKYKEVIEKLELDPVKFDLFKPQRLLKDFFNENNIRFCDLSDTLKESSVNQQTYFNIDSHWNIYGNYIVSEKVFDFCVNAKVYESGKQYKEPK